MSNKPPQMRYVIALLIHKLFSPLSRLVELKWNKNLIMLKIIMFDYEVNKLIYLKNIEKLQKKIMLYFKLYYKRDLTLLYFKSFPFDT
jgi:hypothetical protein